MSAVETLTHLITRLKIVGWQALPCADCGREGEIGVSDLNAALGETLDSLRLAERARYLLYRAVHKFIKTLDGQGRERMILQAKALDVAELRQAAARALAYNDQSPVPAGSAARPFEKVPDVELIASMRDHAAKLGGDSAAVLLEMAERLVWRQKAREALLAVQGWIAEADGFDDNMGGAEALSAHINRVGALRAGAKAAVAEALSEAPSQPAASIRAKAGDVVLRCPRCDRTRTVTAIGFEMITRNQTEMVRCFDCDLAMLAERVQ